MQVLENIFIYVFLYFTICILFYFFQVNMVFIVLFVGFCLFWGACLFFFHSLGRPRVVISIFLVSSDIN